MKLGGGESMVLKNMRYIKLEVEIGNVLCVTHVLG